MWLIRGWLRYDPTYYSHCHTDLRLMSGKGWKVEVEGRLMRGCDVVDDKRVDERVCWCNLTMTY